MPAPYPQGRPAPRGRAASRASRRPRRRPSDRSRAGRRRSRGPRSGYTTTSCRTPCFASAARIASTWACGISPSFSPNRHRSLPADLPGAASVDGAAARALRPRDAAAVEARRGAHVGLAGGEIRHVPADAEAHRADPSPRTSLRARSQRDRRLRVRDHLVGARAAPSSFMPPAMPVVVVAVLDAGPGAVEVVRRERDVALARDALGHVADVRLMPKISM